MFGREVFCLVKGEDELLLGEQWIGEIKGLENQQFRAETSSLERRETARSGEQQLGAERNSSERRATAESNCSVRRATARSGEQLLGVERNC